MVDIDDDDHDGQRLLSQKHRRWRNRLALGRLCVRHLWLYHRDSSQRNHPLQTCHVYSRGGTVQSQQETEQLRSIVKELQDEVDRIKKMLARNTD